MPVPKKRRSSSKSAMKVAIWQQMDTPNFSKCSNCGEPVIPHRACGACGFYKGRQVVTIKTKKPESSKE